MYGTFLAPGDPLSACWATRYNSQLCLGTKEVELRLQRLSGPYSMHSHHEDSDAYGASGRQGEPDDWRVCVDFQRFGAGSENFSWFKVSLGWSDVEALIQTFSAMEHPEAARLQRARKLAAAFDEFSKVPLG